MMSFRRATCQSHRTLREHYQEAAADSHAGVAEAARKMLLLIEQLEVTFRDKPVWGLTSLYNLKLLAADDWKTRWHVSVTPPVGGSFIVEYLMPDSEAPWPNARVVGEADDVEHAVEMIQRAMVKSGGWKKE